MNPAMWASGPRRATPATVSGRSELPRARTWLVPRVGWVAAACISSLLAVLPPCRATAAAEPHQRIEQAITEYAAALETRNRPERLQRFARAEQLFRQVIEGDAEHPAIRNSALYANLGNAALQAERLGPAIAAYRRALLWEPHHAQARQNLAYARSLLPEWIRYDESEGWIDSLFFWRALVPRPQRRLLAAWFFLAAAVLLAIGSARRQAWLRHLAILPLLLWGAVGLSVLLDREEGAQRNAVVVGEATVYTADSENAAPRLARPLPSGAELSLLEQRDRWSEVQLPGGRTGWILTSVVDRLTD